MGIVDRKCRHVVEIDLTLVHLACLPMQYWSDAFFTATFVINRLPLKVLSGLSPHEKLFETPLVFFS